MPYRIIPDGGEPSDCFLSREEGLRVILQGFKKKMFSADEVGALTAAMVDLPVDYSAIYELTKAFKATGELDGFSFQVCPMCEPIPGLQHGRFLRGEEKITEHLDTLDDAWVACQDLTANGVTAEQAILLFQAVLRADLPHDNKVGNQRWKAIPEHERQAIKQRHDARVKERLAAAGVSVLDLDEVRLPFGGGMSGLVIEIDMSRFSELFGGKATDE